MTATKRSPAAPTRSRVKEALAWLEANRSQTIRDEMGPRYGIHTKKAYGVSMANMKALGKRLGRDHELAAALWATGWYEARTVAAFVDDPALVTAEQMDRWCDDFDNWGICDTVCFALFDRAPYAWSKVEEWSERSDEFGKRAAFALLASIALHDRRTDDDAFSNCLPLMETAAADERNFVKKGVLWALRAVGNRSPELHAEAFALAQRLAATPAGSARWIGKSALRELAKRGARST